MKNKASSRNYGVMPHRVHNSNDDFLKTNLKISKIIKNTLDIRLEIDE